MKDPDFDLNRFNLLLLNAFYFNIKAIVLINKIELINLEELEEFKRNLSFLDELDIEVFYISTYNNTGISKLEEKIKDNLTALGGPSGVGKSSLINLLQNKENLEIGETSKKISRGKHTTKGTKLLPLNIGGYVIDTPGFSSIEVPTIDSCEELLSLFPEFYSYKCKFNNCKHLNEPSCGVKDAVDENKISHVRYEFYKKIYEVLETERWNKYD